MIPSQRIPYDPIVGRKPLKLDNARLIVWPIVNVEVWRIERAMPRQVLPPPTHVTTVPDVPAAPMPSQTVHLVWSGSWKRAAKLVRWSA